jgi:hypothetical protein
MRREQVQQQQLAIREQRQQEKDERIAREVEKKKIEEDNGIEIDHHDEYVLGRLAHTDAKLESLSQRMDAFEQNYLKSNLALEKRLSLIELHAQANATEA